MSTEQPTITAHVPVPVAAELIVRAGITIVAHKGGNRYNVPEEARDLIGGHDFTWDSSEALQWAITIVALADLGCLA